MSRLIVRQPNGKFALFSTFSDTFVLIEATREELLDAIIEDEVRELRRIHGERIDRAERVGTSCMIDLGRSWTEYKATSFRNGVQVVRCGDGGYTFKTPKHAREAALAKEDDDE